MSALRRPYWIRAWPRWAMAFSLAHLCLVRAWYSTLFPAGYGYYNQIPVTLPLLVALLLNLVLLTLVFKLGIFAARRSSREWTRRLGTLVLALLFLIPVNFVRLQYLGIAGADMVRFLIHPAVLGGALVAAILIWRWHYLAVRVLRGFLLVMVPLALVTLFQLLQLMVATATACPPEGVPAHAALLPAEPGRPRVVWILFDEWDYRVTFEHRPPGLALPEIDRLQSESLFAEQAREPGPETMVALPTLLNGHPAVQAEPQSDRELAVTFEGSAAPVPWSTTTSVFSKVRALGFNNAVVAWYHPYRRLFGADLAYVSSQSIPLFEQARGSTFGGAMASQLWSVLAPLQQRRLTTRVYEEGLRDALQAVTNPVYGLSFLHLLGPHDPGIYRADTGRFTRWSFSTVEGYFGNLALTDRTLGVLRRAMEQAGVWDSTWLIASSDHRWRKADRYDGVLDNRVPFIVKPPGPPAGRTLAFPLHTVLTHDLILAILRGELKDGDAALAWIRDRAENTRTRNAP